MVCVNEAEGAPGQVCMHAHNLESRRPAAGVYAGSMSRLLRVAGSAVQVGEIVAMEDSVRVIAVVDGIHLWFSVPSSLVDRDIIARSS